ncbi:4-hydroxy-tetrahydrodipicolinate synthase [Rhodopila sp.]|jgi:4-hydroxy-tetrahydrodipicolinate synthase|uniref:4-hydroxy-tetrahydrodipicolinate synthase n=1 Tax=Rhodopila sp. TaxID=2480087 RepID=UPI002D1BC421|nr:4-hydroxy-tetrahydrodipicolinate synthase [Rhodopila sp.]HVZ06322.1 4-hydroxy-tetrahydrodipicolinate synthase [Rhodopila sp.]
MTLRTQTRHGVWLPLITPFRDGQLDEPAVRRLVGHYARTPIDGLILAATTGEGLTLSDQEVERLVILTEMELSRANCGLPIVLGLCGSHTARLVDRLTRTARWPIDGYLIACPYYTRPSQQGLVRHFTVLADAATRPVMIYNIPYRTGVNLQNPAMLELAEHPRIAGVKDCCADPAQSADLIARRPTAFAVLTGEDAQFHSALMQGADGGILASAHIHTGDFAAIRRMLSAGDQDAAAHAWRDLSALPALLFSEPNPAPIKHWLWRCGLINSPELRLPMTLVSDTLATRIDKAVAAEMTTCGSLHRMLPTGTS